MPLFNIFTDPVLRQRQDQLNATWISLMNAGTGCDGLPDSAWLELVNDKKAWDEFYDSGSDWSDDSKHATDAWQLKAQDWSKRLPGYGCGGKLGTTTILDEYGNVTGRETVVSTTGDRGIPGVKDPPKDEEGITDRIGGAIATAGWVAAGLVLLLIVGAFWVLNKSAGAAGTAIGRRA